MERIVSTASSPSRKSSTCTRRGWQHGLRQMGPGVNGMEARSTTLPWYGMSKYLSRLVGRWGHGKVVVGEDEAIDSGPLGLPEPPVGLLGGLGLGKSSPESVAFPHPAVSGAGGGKLGGGDGASPSEGVVGLGLGKSSSESVTVPHPAGSGAGGVKLAGGDGASASEADVVAIDGHGDEGGDGHMESRSEASESGGDVLGGDGTSQSGPPSSDVSRGDGRSETLSPFSRGSPSESTGGERSSESRSLASGSTKGNKLGCPGGVSGGI